MSTFCAVDDAAIVSLIHAAKQRIVFIAPGMTLPVAEALGKRIEELDQLNITVALDSDEEVFRVGYGEMEALQFLQSLANKQGFSLRSQVGLRVGVLLSDENMMVWSPTPRSVEAPPESHVNAPIPPDSSPSKAAYSPQFDAFMRAPAPPAPMAPNGLMLGSNPAAQLAKAVAAEGTETKLQDAEIGRQAITPVEIQVTATALTKNPPIPVDLARITRVFNTKFHFVEYKVTRAKLSKMKLPVPKGLLNSDAKGELEGLIESKLSAFSEMRDVEIDVPAFVNGVAAESNGKPLMIKVSEVSLGRERNSIEKRFVYDILDYGHLIEKEKKDEFIKLLKAYETQLLAHSTGVRNLLDQQATQIVSDALDLIVSRHNSGIVQGKKNQKLDRDKLREELFEGLDRAKNEVPTFKLIFKDVTYEQTQSSIFRERLDKALPITVRKRLGAWDTHFDAARESVKPSEKNAAPLI